MMIDFRSDTVTRPTAGMRAAMMDAATGDDVFGEDPSVNALEELTAGMFGREAALFCPSGTMSNQIAIRCHTQPGDEVICASNAHVYIYEGGGIASNAGSQARPVEGDRGRISASQVRAAINPDDVHKANTSLVCLENTSNRGGGGCYDFEEIGRIRTVCDENQLALHLDGARLFNALVAKKQAATQYGKAFHSISVCLNKGLGCPMGSVLIGDGNFIRKARRIRKVFGGGMRQAGFMAATGIYALKNHIDRLSVDHLNAAKIEKALLAKSFVKEIMPVETNIVIATVKEGFTGALVAAALEKAGILVIAISPMQVRFVTHLDITAQMLDHAVAEIEGLEF